MSFWDTVTGNDLSRDWKAFETRAQALPDDYRAAWEQIKGNLFAYGDFSGRNLTPVADTALGLLEESSAEGQSVQEVLGDDIPGFCAALAGGNGAHTYRDRWREQLNTTVARKLARLGG
ncbi:hypothetical protein Ait01nite_027870 [Actinoplanes italicus]|uniref:DNA-binding ferritin-like protein (Dps family) n=1 Tax=Actinoplanes italicus TaxID=113567 RepID=A0A2T0KEM7_9ACTN|nr:DUF1048 domain-containing protein [Actinoplanes italicus]PRX21841.1 DNA-binding ferritin-like protein (Dps family) [Actinoplanes italicus]GIE29742.1 hypothetical protein Ait01nite_027870 [Actinoplanes italicus]